MDGNSGESMNEENPIIPAFRMRGTRSRLIAFRCPFCSRVHTHGCGNGRSVQWRGSHCQNGAMNGKNFRLLVIAEVASERMLPKPSIADIVALNAALASCDDAI